MANGTGITSIITDPLTRYANRLQYGAEETIRDIPVVRNIYNTAKSEFQQTTSSGAYNPALPGDGTPSRSPMDPLINTAGQNADRAANKLNSLQRELEAAGDNPPPGLLARIQIATQAYQAWMTCLKSCADSKGQVQGELARFR